MIIKQELLARETAEVERRGQPLVRPFPAQIFDEDATQIWLVGRKDDQRINAKVASLCAEALDDELLRLA